MVNKNPKLYLRQSKHPRKNKKKLAVLGGGVKINVYYLLIFFVKKFKINKKLKM